MSAEYSSGPIALTHTAFPIHPDLAIQVIEQHLHHVETELQQLIAEQVAE